MPENSPLLTVHDVANASALLAGVVALIGLTYSLIAPPGFVLPALLAIGAAAVEIGRRCWAKPAQSHSLAKLSPTFVSTAAGAVIFALIMPALFPNGAYERARWLVWIDASFLLGGLLAIPCARLLLGVAVRIARRRQLRN